MGGSARCAPVSSLLARCLAEQESGGRHHGAESRQYHKTERDTTFHVLLDLNDYHLTTIRNVCIDESSISTFLRSTVRGRLLPYLLTFSSSGASLFPVVVPPAPKYDSSGWIPAWVTLHRCYTTLSRQSYSKEP